MDISLVSLFNDIRGLFDVILIKEQWWYYLTHSWVDNWVHIFPMSISSKGNVIARLGFEPAYYG